MNKLFVAAVLLFASTQSFALTDQEAIDLGMTPIEKADGFGGMKSASFNPNIDQLIKKAEVVVVVDKSVRTSRNPHGQTAMVYVDGNYYSEYDVSTGSEAVKTTTSGRKYVATTPVGIFRPTRAYKNYMSRTFLGAPMTWAVFFNGGIALHSTERSHYNHLGQRASGGCVRFRFEEAHEVNQLVVSRGEANMNMVDQSEVVNDVMVKRELYINRARFPVVDRMTGAFDESQTMWTYDTLVAVIGG